MTSPASDNNPSEVPVGGDITITTNVIPEHIDRPRVQHAATRPPLTPVIPPVPSLAAEEQIEERVDNDQHEDEPNNELDNVPATSSQVHSEYDVPTPLGSDEGESSGVIFGPVDPPPTRPTRYPQPIDRFSYPASHVKDQRLNRLTKWKH